MNVGGIEPSIRIFLPISVCQLKKKCDVSTLFTVDCILWCRIDIRYTVIYTLITILGTTLYDGQAWINGAL